VAVVFIVIGVLMVVGLLGGIGFYIYRKKKKGSIAFYHLVQEDDDEGQELN